MWGVGCILWEMVVLRRPFLAQSLSQLLADVKLAAYDDHALAAAPYHDALKVGKGMATRTHAVQERAVQERVQARACSPDV